MTDLRTAIHSARRARDRAVPTPEKEPQMEPSGIASLSDATPLPPQAQGRTGKGASRIAWLGYAAVFLVIGVLMLALATPGTVELASGGCRNSPGRLIFGETFEVAMSLHHNTACSVRLRPGSAAVDKLEITQPPRHGVLIARGRTGAIYRPDRNFRGEDFFSFAMHGQSSAYKGTSVVRVRVLVR
jgi:hypothetical protein